LDQKVLGTIIFCGDAERLRMPKADVGAQLHQRLDRGRIRRRGGPIGALNVGVA
jgi:hypothetical protein